MKRLAFTLIELLVVIAIIAVILFPVFAKAREKARQITCTSNEKQLRLGFLQYVQDNDEKFPSGGTPDPPLTSIYGTGWNGNIYSYVKSTAVSACPDDSMQGNNNGNVPNTPVSYAFNENLYGGGPTGGLASLNALASTVLLCTTDESGGANHHHYNLPVADGLDVNVGGAAPNDIIDSNDGKSEYQTMVYATGPMGGIPPASASHFTSAPGIHTNGSNFLFADGHAKWLRDAAVSPGVTVPATTCGQAGTGTGCGGATNNAAGEPRTTLRGSHEQRCGGATNNAAGTGNLYINGSNSIGPVAATFSPAPSAVFSPVPLVPAGQRLLLAALFSRATCFCHNVRPVYRPRRSNAGYA